VISPVADLVGYSLAKSHISYNNLPVASADLHACPRLHQLLFNEIVDIIKETDDEYHISIPHLFFITQTNKKPHCSYWVEKKHIVPLNAIKKHEQQYIPESIDFRNNKNSNQKIITLIKPLFCKKMNITFSVGTRFVLHVEKPSQYIAYAYDPKQKQFIDLCMNKSYAMPSQQKNKELALQTYAKLLKSWANMPGYTPYIWGGCSLTTQNKTDIFSLKSQTKNYVIKDDSNIYKHGFDCAGLITRAAQAAGLPYYYKNTTTLAHYLKPIQQKDKMRDGDLIWIPGHVMAIGSLKDNTVIEARHYSHGYGKLHEIPLQEIFKSIKTFEQLFDAVSKKQTLERLNKNGIVVQKIDDTKLLSMASCYITSSIANGQ
jgi:cell wall-associated NlpC family hydrolase